MKLTITEEFSAVLRNEKSAIIGQFWYDKVEVEPVGKKRKVSFFMDGNFTGYVTAGEVEDKRPISEGAQGE